MEFDFEIVQVSIAENYALQITFKDNTKGVVYFKPSFFKGVFQPLLDTKKFEQVYIENDTITWRGGLDIAPDALYQKIKVGGGKCFLS